MGLFDWLQGKPQPKATKPPPPKILSQMSENSPHIVVESGKGFVTIMDRETYDYMYGHSDAPNPLQKDLDDLLPRVSRIRAIAGGMFRGRAMLSEVVIDTSDAAAVAAFKTTLRISEDPATFTHCGCLGGPTVELFSGADLIATIGLQHGRAIRWAHWKHDAQLRDGKPLNDWLLQHGMDSEFLECQLQNQYDVGGLQPLGFLRGGATPLSRAEQRLRLADLARVRGGDINKALAKCQKVLDAEPDVAFGYAIRALIHHHRQDFAKCIADCTEAMRLGMRQAEVLFTRAVAFDNCGQSQEALADCTAALAIDPKHTNALNSRGLIQMKLGKMTEALADLNEAVAQAPKWPLPYINRAQLHHMSGRLDAALADYDRVIELMPRGSPNAQTNPMLGMIFWNRGQLHRATGNSAKAEADFQEAVRLNPKIQDQMK
jgi:Tfp pilus assembly protein PilF